MEVAPEIQIAFETLRENFANLIQPDERMAYTKHTDASSKAIGAVLMLKDPEGNVNIVSTAPRVKNSAEKRCTTCEQEHLAMVYALEKFRVHVYGNKIFFNLVTDTEVSGSIPGATRFLSSSGSGRTASVV